MDDEYTEQDLQEASDAGLLSLDGTVDSPGNAALRRVLELEARVSELERILGL